MKEKRLERMVSVLDKIAECVKAPCVLFIAVFTFEGIYFIYGWFSMTANDFPFLMDTLQFEYSKEIIRANLIAVMMFVMIFVIFFSMNYGWIVFGRFVLLSIELLIGAYYQVENVLFIFTLSCVILWCLLKSMKYIIKFKLWRMKNKWAVTEKCS